MAPDSEGTRTGETAEIGELDPETLLPATWYDRSSLRGDFLVMIADQTEEDYLRKAPNYPFCEFIDGIVYMHAAVSDRHQFNVQFLLVLMAMFNSIHESGLILSGPARLRVRDGCYLKPDLFVLPLGTQRRDDDLTPDPPALLVVEVLSPSTRKYDLDQKAALYDEANTVEVWFIDGRDQVVIVDRQTAGGRESRRVASGPLVSAGLPGFWFDVSWLWADPQPSLSRCLDQILAGLPA